MPIHTYMKQQISISNNFRVEAALESRKFLTKDNFKLQTTLDRKKFKTLDNFRLWTVLDYRQN